MYSYRRSRIGVYHVLYGLADATRPAVGKTRARDRTKGSLSSGSCRLGVGHLPRRRRRGVCFLWKARLRLPGFVVPSLPKLVAYCSASRLMRV